MQEVDEPSSKMVYTVELKQAAFPVSTTLDRSATGNRKPRTEN
jgi:hypothetical protein